MNQSAFLYPHRGPRDGRGQLRLPAGMVAVVLIALTLAFWIGGCADKRDEPTAPVDPGYTRHIPLWTDVQSSGERIRADFTVDQDLAATDVPARLTLVAYIHTPDDPDLVRYDQIMDSLTWLDDAFTRYDTKLFRLNDNLQTLHEIDSLWLLYPDSLVPAFDSSSCDTHVTICGETIICDSLNWVQWPDSLVRAFDTTGLGTCWAWINDQIAVYNDSVTWSHAAFTRMSDEWAVITPVLDDRYAMSIWLDSDTTTRFPDAVYADSVFHLQDQLIYANATDSASGYKAKAFVLDLLQFQTCDPVNIGEAMEVNWVTCFLGSDRPCLSPGPHTIWARLTGASTKITGTLVLVYEERGQ